MISIILVDLCLLYYPCWSLSSLLISVYSIILVDIYYPCWSLSTLLSLLISIILVDLCLLYYSWFIQEKYAKDVEEFKSKVTLNEIASFKLIKPLLDKDPKFGKPFMKFDEMIKSVTSHTAMRNSMPFFIKKYVYGNLSGPRANEEDIKRLGLSYPIEMPITQRFKLAVKAYKSMSTEELKVNIG